MIGRLKSIYYRSCGLFVCFVWCKEELRIKQRAASAYIIRWDAARVKVVSACETSQFWKLLDLIFQLPFLIDFCYFSFCPFSPSVNYVSIYDDYVLEIMCCQYNEKYLWVYKKNPEKKTHSLPLGKKFKSWILSKYIYPSHPENSKMRPF